MRERLALGCRRNRGPLTGSAALESSPESSQQSAKPDGRKPLRWSRIAVAATVTIIAVAVVVGALVQMKRAASDGSGLLGSASGSAIAEQVDEPAPQFSVDAVDPADGVVALDNYRGSVIVVNFWASWCGPCRVETPELVRVAANYQERGVQFIGVDIQDSRVAAQAFIDEFGVGYPNAFDQSGRIAADYRLPAVPGTYVIDRNGRLIYRFFGKVAEAALVPAIEAALAGDNSR